MEPIDQAIVDMHARLARVERNHACLRTHVRECGERQLHILVQMQKHAVAMRRDAEAMHQSAGRMWVEVGRYTSVFDPVHAAMREDVL